MIILPYPDPALMPNRTKGQSWKKVYAIRKKAFSDSFYITKSNKPIDVSGGLKITFYTPNRIKRDNDNLLSAMKPYLDGFAKALGIDDVSFNPILITRVDGVGKENARVEIEGL